MELFSSSESSEDFQVSNRRWSEDKKYKGILKKCVPCRILRELTNPEFVSGHFYLGDCDQWAFLLFRSYMI